MILLLALTALAQDPVDPASDARARELFENGALLYDEGRYEDAIAAWEAAWKLSPRPLLLFNMANAAERLGRYEEAMDLLSRYRAFAPADERETLDRRIRNINARIDEQSALRTTPAPVDPEPTTGLRPVPIVLFGVSGLALGGGVLFGNFALDARDEAEASCAVAGELTWCKAGAGEALTRDVRNSLIADVAFGTSILAFAGGVVTALLPGPDVVAAPTPGLDGGVVGVRGSF